MNYIFAKSDPSPLSEENSARRYSPAPNEFKNRQLRRSEWRICRILYGIGGWNIWNENGSALVSTRAFPTKQAALIAAASGPDAYTHATGSGTYWPGVRSIRAFRQE